MEKRYEIKESSLKLPLKGRLVLAKALGEKDVAYVDNGGFYDPTAGEARTILVGRGNERDNVNGILALIGPDETSVVINGNGRYADKVRLHYEVNELINSDNELRDAA